MREADIWRRAAGVADYIGQGSPGRHFGRWLCLNCPRDWHEPPFLPFRLRIHVREHRERFPDHAIAWWCWDHLAIEAAHATGWRWFYDPLYVEPSSAGGADIPRETLLCDRPARPAEAVPEDMGMCTYRRVTVTWPDGRKIKLIVEDDGAKPKRCGICGLNEASFRRRDLVPHDDLGHQQLYHDAKVTRGRRLSPEQAAAIRGVQEKEAPESVPWQASFPGVLVDVGERA